MTTVADIRQLLNNAKTKLVGDSQTTQDIYARPTAGTNAAGGSELGPGATDRDAPPGPIPDNRIRIIDVTGGTVK